MPVAEKKFTVLKNVTLTYYLSYVFYQRDHQEIQQQSRVKFWNFNFYNVYSLFIWAYYCIIDAFSNYLF